jgi:hypothetical protein
MTTAPVRQWIGYDWFKLIVAIILVLLLLIFWLTGGGTPAVQVAPAVAPAATAAPAGQVATVATAAPVATVAAPAAPAAPVAPIAAPTLNTPSSTLTPGAITFSGTGLPNAQIEILLDGQSVGKASVSADGTWSLPATLLVGEHTINVRALDSAGATVAEAEQVRVTVAAGPAAPPVAGAAPAISFPAEGAQLPSGPFTISGTGAPGSQIEVLDSDKVIGTATVGTNGTWSLPVTPAGTTAAYSARPAGSTDVAATPIRVGIGSAAPGCDSLAINCDAWVTRSGGRILRLRAGVGIDQAVLFKLPVGTQVKLLEGPQPADGYTWWRIATLGGREGWVAGEELRTKPD